MIRTIYFVFTVVLLSGCLVGKQTRRKRRAQRKMERACMIAPEMCWRDTLVVHDTVVVERVQMDTVTSIVYHDTTIIVNNERVMARYFYDTTRMEIHHEIECKEIHKPIETRVVFDKFTPLNWLERNSGRITWITVALIVAMLLLRYLFGK